MRSDFTTCGRAAAFGRCGVVVRLPIQYFYYEAEQFINIIYGRPEIPSALKMQLDTFENAHEPAPALDLSPYTFSVICVRVHGVISGLPL